MLLHSLIIEVLPAFMGNMGRVDVATPRMSVNRASTEPQQMVNKVSMIFIMASVLTKGLCYRNRP